MPDNGEQQPPGQPEYKVYRSRRGFFSRFRSPDLSSLRERLRREAGPERKEEPSEERPWWRRRWRWWVLAALGGWVLVSFLAFAVSAQLQAWKLDDGARSTLDGSPFVLVQPQTILVIGTDARPAGTQEPGAESREQCVEQAARGEPPRGNCSEGTFRADTLMLVRAGRGTFRKLSIPRDSFAEVPGQGAQKINGAYAFGGAELQIRTVEQFLGIEVDHVVILDFDAFEDFIDAIGGVEVDLKRKFCAEISGGAGGGQGGISLRLGKGENSLSGEQALALARARTIVDCPGPGADQSQFGYDDLARVRTQQEILSGIKGRLTSPLRLPYNFIKGPIIGWTAPKAFVSDMGALTMPQLVLSAVLPGGDDTIILKPSGQGPSGSLEISDAERQKAVDKLLNG